MTENIYLLVSHLVEFLAKVDVESSNLFARSNFSNGISKLKLPPGGKPVDIF